MFKVRVSISALMMVVVLFALEFAALRSGSQLWFSAVYSVTVVLLLFAVVAAKYGRREARAFWFGFAVFGWAYLLLALGPWTIESDQLTPNSNLLTTEWIDTSLHWVRGDAPATGYGSPMRMETDDISEFARNTTNLAHLMVTLALALLGGGLAAGLKGRRTNPREGGAGPSKSASLVSLTLTGLVLSALLGSAAYDYARPLIQYFPDRAFSPQKGLNQFIVKWYSKHLRAMSEPSLLKLSQTDRATTVYRLLWLPSFHHPAAIRLVKAGEAGTLRLVILDGAGGYEPGQIAIDRTIKLTPEQWKELEGGFARMKFWTVPTMVKDSGAEDGANLILEGAQDGHYHFIDRREPDPECLALCQSIVDLSRFPSLRKAFDDYHTELSKP